MLYLSPTTGGFGKVGVAAQACVQRGTGSVGKSTRTLNLGGVAKNDTGASPTTVS